MRPSEPVRAWIYRSGLAVVSLAAIYGLIGEDEVTGWTALVVAIGSTGLATLNTDRH